MGWTSKSYNKFVVEWLSRIEAQPATADDALLDHFRAYNGATNKWPTDDEIEIELVSQPLYGRMRPGRVAMILRADELDLPADSEDEKLSRKLSVEHIIPQGWVKDKWPLPADLGGEDAQLERARAIHLLGNLTLTRGRLNSSMSNKASRHKQPLLNLKSTLLINSQLISSYPDSFDETSISQRGRALADRIVNIWPGPFADW